MIEELRRMVGMDETILYEGKPDKKCFIFESIFNPLLSVAIIWAIFDAGFLGMAMGGMNFIMIPFFLFHLMPVWIYIAGVILFIQKIQKYVLHCNGSWSVHIQRYFCNESDSEDLCRIIPRQFAQGHF